MKYEERTHQPPILHVVILAKAPVHLIQNIITHFEYSVLHSDNVDQYPLVLLANEEEGLEWDEGLRQIVEATVITQQQHPSIYTAAKYRLKKRYQAEAKNADEMMNGHTALTELYLSMVAATGGYHDLSVMYGMMRWTHLKQQCS